MEPHEDTPVRAAWRLLAQIEVLPGEAGALLAGERLLEAIRPLDVEPGEAGRLAAAVAAALRGMSDQLDEQPVLLRILAANLSAQAAGCLGFFLVHRSGGEGRRRMEIRIYREQAAADA